VEAIAQARASLAADSLAADELADPILGPAVEAAELVGAITEDRSLALAVLGAAALGAGMSRERVARHLGQPVRQAAEELRQLIALDLGRARSGARELDATRAEALRKMLLAMASDPRLVSARLAIALVQLRAAKRDPPETQARLAEQTQSLLAPLANRLGLWQMKWELEDLAFRYLAPVQYREIATALAEKRADRERYIAEFSQLLARELAALGIEAEVRGRPKHLYSIYRKMRRKELAFEELFDVRAVRIVVATVAECYAALGLVHSRWRYLPQEFDDYIATPKPNSYRSIHTAVIGPEGKPVEVQIRTREMHAHSELGVAAHWRYKEGGGRDADYERKIEWARRLLEPGEPAATGAVRDERGAEDEDADPVDRVRARLFEDRVYALTPRGDVVELVAGATPLDFAYHVHTELGHRTRGAKVNGRIVPLGYTLRTGEVVEIIAQKSGAPSRDWLSPEAGVLASPRSRAKVRAWFRRQRENAAPDHAAAPVAVETPPPEPSRRRRRPARPGALPIAIEGLDDLPVILARCCAPMRPQPITGYLTVGRGVTVHRDDCAGLRRMRAAHPARALLAHWSEDETRLLSVEITVDAWNRPGLVRDLTDVLASEQLGIEALSSTTERGEGTARAVVRFSVAHLDALEHIERRLRAVSAVTAVRRSG
jgi:GTP pyrophosphokinase